MRLTVTCFCILMAGVCLGQHRYTVFNTTNSPLPDNTIRVIEFAPNGDIWIGTDWGLVKLVGTTLEVFQVANSPLPDNGIRCIAFDPDGYLWIGTFLGGVASIRDTGWLLYNTQNSPLPDDHIKAMAFDTAGHPYFGTVAGIASKQDTGWLQYNTSNAPMDVNNVATVYIDSSNTQWFGLTNGGLMRLQAGNWTKFNNGNSALTDNTILDIAPVGNGGFWFAMPAGGAGFYDGQFSIYNTLNSGNPSNSLKGVALDSAGNVYFASAGKGLVSFSGGNNWASYSTLDRPDLDSMYLPENDLLCVAVDHQQRIWMGTMSNGLVMLELVEDTTDTTIGISSLAGLQVSIGPNPVQHQLYVNHVPQRGALMLYNLNGQLLLHQPLEAGSNTVSVNGLPQGVYLVAVQQGTRVAYTTINKQ